LAASEKMQKTYTQKIIYTAVFVALGVLVPFATAHLVGAGPVFLPMHIPVLLAGLILGPLWGAVVGVLSPFLSSVTTGMPVMYPMMPIMVVELGVYGFAAGFLYKKLKLPLFIALPAAMVLGRVGYAAMWGMLFAFNSDLRAATVLVAVTTGVPGIAIQLGLIPLLMNAIEPRTRSKIKSALNRRAIVAAREKIQSRIAALVVIKRGKIVFEDTRQGIAAALELLENNPQLLRGAIVVDKVVGKAAASLFILGKARFVYGLTLSRPAKSVLEGAGVSTGFLDIADVIKDRQKTGVCPIEQSVYDISSAEDALPAIKTCLAELRRKSAERENV